MAGRIEAIDVAERAFEIVTGTPRDPVGAIRAELTRIAAAEAPVLPVPGATTPQAAAVSPVLTEPGVLPSLGIFLNQPAATAVEAARAFGSGREFDSSDKAGVIFARVTLQDFSADAARISRESAARVAALPTVGVNLESVVPRPGTEAIREAPATFEIPIPAVNPVPDVREMGRLSALAGLAANDPRAIAAYAPPPLPPAPLAVDAATGTVSARGGTIGNVRGRLIVHIGGAAGGGGAPAAGEGAQSFGVGVGIDLAA